MDWNYGNQKHKEKIMYNIYVERGTEMEKVKFFEKRDIERQTYRGLLQFTNISVHVKWQV